MLLDVGYDYGNESKVSVVGSQGKDEGISLSLQSSISTNVQSSSSKDENKRHELFHVRAITKHTKIDTLFDIGLHVNLVSEEVVKKLGLATIPHENTYPLGWVSNYAQIQVTKKCVLNLAISSKFKDEVDLDVVLGDNLWNYIWKPIFELSKGCMLKGEGFLE